jgi:hypothetical protein
VDLRRQVQRADAFAGQRLEHLLAQHLLAAAALERQRTGDEVVERGAERIDVGAHVELAALGLLRRDVVHGARGLLRLRAATGGGARHREAEVDQHGTALHGPDHVARLDVTVHEPARVQRAERGADLGRDLERGLLVEPAAVAQHVLQAAARQLLHREEERVAFLGDAEAAHDVVVVQLEQQAGFAHERLDRCRVLRQFGPQHLERDRATVSAVDGTEHARGAAFADQLPHVVAAQLRPRATGRSDPLRPLRRRALAVCDQPAAHVAGLHGRARRGGVDESAVHQHREQLQFGIHRRFQREHRQRLTLSSADTFQVATRAFR